MGIVTADAQSDHHWQTQPTYQVLGSQELGEVHHRLVDAFLWRLFPDALQGDFQLISCLRL